MHAFYDITEGRFFGIGKTLLNLVSVIAKSGGVKTLFTAAPYPIKGFFEHIGWSGEMIYTDYKIHDSIVNLPQFKCSFSIPDNFKGF